MPLMRVKIMFVLALPAVILPAHCAGADDPWQSLKDLPHNVGFVFIQRDMTCQYGQISAVTAQNVLVRTDQSDVTFEKSSLIRVRRGFSGRPVQEGSPNLVLATVYSGRSSWTDVVGFGFFQPNDFKVRMSVSTAGGKPYRGDLDHVTESAITLADAFGKAISIAKTDVARIDFVRNKPLSDKQEFYWDELAALRILDPALYPRFFHLGDKMAVRLYDSAFPEDDSPVRCK